MYLPLYCWNRLMKMKWIWNPMLWTVKVNHHWILIIYLYIYLFFISPNMWLIYSIYLSKHVYSHENGQIVFIRKEKRLSYLIIIPYHYYHNYFNMVEITTFVINELLCHVFAAKNRDTRCDIVNVVTDFNCDELAVRYWR